MSQFLEKTCILRFFYALLLVIPLHLHSQNKEGEKYEYFDLVRPKFDGKLAYETTDYVAQYWRVPGNTGFNNSVKWIAKELEKAGYVLESKADANDRLTYRIESRPMKDPTWEPVSALLEILGQTDPILVSTLNRNMTYLNSVSTPKEGITAEVVPIGAKEDIPNLDLKSKVVFMEFGLNCIYQELLDKGVLGVLTYNNPTYLQPEKNITSIQFRSLPPQADTKFWGIALSFEAKERLKSAFKRGETMVKVNIQTKIYEAEELTVIANIKGSKKPSERLVFSAHIQEPGANDNASGVGAQLEMASVAANLIDSGPIDYERTMTFLWGDEISSTHRYIQEDKTRAQGIKWGISLDMVGENTNITGGSFLIEKMPDPSAIWTRGNDKHTEWGGEVLSLKDMRPHYLNDFIIHNFRQQGEFANWEVNTNPFEGGSDHTPFLKANIPGLLLWHFTDQFYHTDNDRIDKVSQKTLQNVGTAALASSLQLVNADEKTALWILSILEKESFERLENEFEQSQVAIEKGSNFKFEKQILSAWEEWYNKAYGSVIDIDDSPKTKSAIAQKQSNLKSYYNKLIGRLKNQ
ncbi:M28 family peptidase [Maribacter aurantiacus]|uniref:M28 family peptidase n=1 Tax=Maribacter aurantiacus TaxID=1882343 RepID=A0A5R8MCC2_9FLAO|nr:M28 family peptidase [Maribacter aurantiacus]TLF46429.1 M28 family peptidase [Maribacter aurantiacus]